MHEGIKKASEHGLLIVAASGNEGNDNGTGNTINYPARHEEVISVAAINRYFKRSSFSGTGDMNDFAAPAEEIYKPVTNAVTTFIKNKTVYNYKKAEAELNKLLL